MEQESSARTQATATGLAEARRKRILFVDDDQAALDVYRVHVRPRETAWECSFALGGQAALDALKKGGFDAVVTDVGMPHPDGAAVLAQVQRQAPQAVRIALAPAGAGDAALRAVGVAHQFLTKPCDRGTLENAIERSLRLQSLIADERIRAMVGLIGALPPQPTVYSALVQALTDPDISVTRIAGILERDMALCAKLLQISNSALFALPHRVATIEDAVSFLGQKTVRSLVLSLSVFQTGATHGAMSAETLQRHALLTGNIAKRIAHRTAHAEDAFLAGVLHDVGILILATKLPGHFHRVLESLRENPRPFHVAERELWGVTHAELGAYLLGLWGLPHPVVEAVAYHHEPEAVPQREFDTLAAVYIANALAHEADHGVNLAANTEAPTMDTGYLEALGLLDHLDEWREIAAETAAAPHGEA